MVTYERHSTCGCGAPIGERPSPRYLPLSDDSNVFVETCEACIEAAFQRKLQASRRPTPRHTCPRCRRQVTSLYQSSLRGLVCLPCFELVS